MMAKTVAPAEFNFAALMERLVPLFAELFATLASRNPLRMHFADIAGKTILDIVDVLRNDGISQEAIAASLGLTINGFRSRMKTLRERFRDGEITTAPDEPRTLLERVYAYVEDSADHRGIHYADIAGHFGGVKADSLRGVLHFLAKSGLLSVSGAGVSKVYRIVNRPRSGTSYVDALVLLFREGPISLTHLSQRLGLSEAACAPYIEQLRAEGQLEETAGVNGAVRYRATSYHIPVDSAEGYEAAIFDHISAVVQAVCRKVRRGTHRATMVDLNGGATFTFEVAEGDPVREEIEAFLPTMRAKLEDWRARAAESLTDHPDAETYRRITIYLGQSVEELDP